MSRRAIECAFVDPQRTDGRSLLAFFLPAVTSYVPEQRSSVSPEVPA
jgi:hypothetical protein